MKVPTYKALSLSGKRIEGYPVVVSGETFMVMEDVRFWVDVNSNALFGVLHSLNRTIPLMFVRFKKDTLQESE